MGEYLGTPYPLALSSGTAAIHLSLKYLGVKEGDIVFCSSFTFSGSCNAVLYEKAVPVFIDSEPVLLFSFCPISRIANHSHTSKTVHTTVKTSTKKVSAFPAEMLSPVNSSSSSQKIFSI